MRPKQTIELPAALLYAAEYLTYIASLSLDRRMLHKKNKPTELIVFYIINYSLFHTSCCSEWTRRLWERISLTAAGGLMENNLSLCRRKLIPYWLMKQFKLSAPIWGCEKWKKCTYRQCEGGKVLRSLALMKLGIHTFHCLWAQSILFSAQMKLVQFTSNYLSGMVEEKNS